MKPVLFLLSNLFALLAVNGQCFVEATVLTPMAKPDRLIEATSIAQTSRDDHLRPQLANSLSLSSFPRFIGKPGGVFNSFIRKNTGKTVYLQLVFPHEIGGYRDINADPFFESTGKYFYFVRCVEDVKPTVPWTSRCKKLSWDASHNKLSGYFKVSSQRREAKGAPTYDPDVLIFELVAVGVNAPT